MAGDYPKTVDEVLGDVRYNRLALAATRVYARMRPWRGSTRQRLLKMRWLLVGLAAAYRVATPTLRCEMNDNGSSTYSQLTATITLRGRLSVLTLLHEFAHHLLGSDERRACRWSVNLFRRCFPRQFARCKAEGHVLRKSAD